ncbi:MAG: carbamoyl phosphate synthase small subunit [Solobacterium sp.]|nr:carbamoyl phosphate synthase small subunit [Solobacterium sp.]
MKRKAWLVLGDGTVLEGTGFGAETECTGELVFTTNMCGYIETLSDPSYAGQIVMQTFPLIGNYGIIPEDFEGEPALKGYAVREYCDTPSNFRCKKTLDTFLKEKGIPGIAGIDTRHVTQILREHGVMNAAIVSKDPGDLSFLRDYAVTDVLSEVSVKEKTLYPAENRKYDVVLIDCGAKQNIIRELNARGCSVTAVPYDTAAEEVLAMDPDGIMLSNGPGDPAENTYTIEQIRRLLGKVPMFGICLGHQLTALAAGASTYKMKYGHRGANQPVKDLVTGRTWITTQNHGYAVDTDSLPAYAKARMINANDGSCEGIDYPEHMCFTVQFHPEACAGPKDTAYLFDRFLKMMEENN